MGFGISKVVPRMFARFPMSTALRKVAPTALSLPLGLAYLVLMFSATAPCSPEAPDAPLAPVELELPPPHAAIAKPARATVAAKARRSGMVLATLTIGANLPSALKPSVEGAGAVPVPLG